MKTPKMSLAICSRCTDGHAASACAQSEQSPPKKNTSASCDSPPTVGTSPSSTHGTNCATPSIGCCENQPTGIEALVCADIARRQQLGSLRHYSCSLCWLVLVMMTTLEERNNMPRQITSCSECKWLNRIGDYWCEHPEGRPIANHVLGRHVADDLIRTQPDWCPLKKDEKCEVNQIEVC